MTLKLKKTVKILEVFGIIIQINFTTNFRICGFNVLVTFCQHLSYIAYPVYYHLNDLKF